MIDDIQAEQELNQREAQEVAQFRDFLGERQFDLHRQSIRSSDSAMAFVGKYKLSINEAVAFREYTANGFWRLNFRLENRNTENQDKAFANILVRALDKLPNYTGIVDRVVYFDQPDHLQKAIARYIIGKTIIEKRFLSTSREIQKDSRSQLRFIIHSKTGKLIEKISSVDIEKEVLFKPQTRFKVINKKVVGSQTVIELSEI